MQGKVCDGDLIEFENELFLQMFQKSFSGKYFYWMYILGNKAKAKLYTVNISVYGLNAKFIRQECEVYSIDTSPRDIMKDKECFQLTDPDLVRQLSMEKDNSCMLNLVTEFNKNYTSL